MGYLRTEFSEGTVICFHAACGFFSEHIVFAYSCGAHGAAEWLDRGNGYLSATMQKTQEEK
jgi:hypothetical protein